MGDLKSLLYMTFIQEDRYKIFLDGLGNTLLLTFISFILGTAVGILLCWAVLSENTAVSKFFRKFRSFLMELPTMVLLMIFVYVVFGKSAMPVFWCVIAGLTLKAGAFLSDIFESGVNTVSPGEIEAARTLGMSRWQAFRYIVLPQTVSAALPMYQSQFVSTMQETSVVGYLAVVDMTRAASVVSSRTLDAVVGLVTVTVMYFIIGAVMKQIFSLIVKRFHRGGETA